MATTNALSRSSSQRSARDAHESLLQHDALSQHLEDIRVREVEYHNEISLLRRELAEQTRALADRDRDAANHAATAADLGTQLTALKQQLKASEQVVATLNRQLAASADAHDALNGDVATLRITVAELREKDGNWAALTERLKQEYYTIMQQWGDMEESVQRTQEELGRKRRSEIKALETSLAEETAKREAADRQLIAQQGEIDRYRAEANEAHKQLEAKAAEVRYEKEALNTSEEQKRAVIAAEAQLREELLKKALEAARQGEQYQLKRFRELKQRYLKKKKNCEGAVERVVELNKEVLHYKLQVASLDTSNTQKDTKIQVLERELADVQQANMALHQQAHTMRLQVKEATVERTANGSPRSTPRARADSALGDGGWEDPVRALQRQARGSARSSVRSSSAGRLPPPSQHSARRGSLSPPRHGTKLRWVSSSPPPLRTALPFCATVKPATPPLTLLQNGPTRDTPFAHDSPAIDHSFRLKSPPAFRQYVLTETGRADVGPASRTSQPVSRRIVSTSAAARPVVASSRTPAQRVATPPLRPSSQRSATASTPVTEAIPLPAHVEVPRPSQPQPQLPPQSTPPAVLPGPPGGALLTPQEGELGVTIPQGVAEQLAAVAPPAVPAAAGLGDAALPPPAPAPAPAPADTSTATPAEAESPAVVAPSPQPGLGKNRRMSKSFESRKSIDYSESESLAFVENATETASTARDRSTTREGDDKSGTLMVSLDSETDTSSEMASDSDIDFYSERASSTRRPSRRPSASATSVTSSERPPRKSTVTDIDTTIDDSTRSESAPS